MKVKEYLKKNRRRVMMSLCGVIICAVSVGVFKLAALGVDPFQSFMAGLDAMIPIEFGTLYVIVNAILLLFSLFVDRHNIGIATFINLFLLGYITQFTYDLLQKLIPDPSMIVRILCLSIGIVVIGCILFVLAGNVPKVKAFLFKRFIKPGKCLKDHNHGHT